MVFPEEAGTIQSGKARTEAPAISMKPAASPYNYSTDKRVVTVPTSKKSNGNARKQLSPAELAMLHPAILLTPKQGKAAQAYKLNVESHTTILLNQQDNRITRAQSREQLAELLRKASERQDGHEKCWFPAYQLDIALTACRFRSKDLETKQGAAS